MLPAMIPILVMVMMPPSKVSPVVVVRALLPAVTMIIVMVTVAIIVIVSGIVDTLAGTILRFVQVIRSRGSNRPSRANLSSSFSILR